LAGQGKYNKGKRERPAQSSGAGRGRGRGGGFWVGVNQGRDGTVPAQLTARGTPRSVLKRLRCLRADDKIEFIHVTSDHPTFLF
jgi:hypothetical protein